MNSKMQILSVTQTGHVVAAFTRTADPEGMPSVAEMFRSGLAVRNGELLLGAGSPSGGETLIVPPEVLETTVVNLNPAVFQSPLSFVSGAGQVLQAGANPIVFVNSPLPPPPPAIPAPITPPQVNFNKTRATIVIGGNTPDDKGVCLVLEEKNPSGGNAPERRFAQGVIKSGEHYASLDWKTSPGGALAPILNDTSSFYILALVAGFSPTFGTKIPS